MRTLKIKVCGMRDPFNLQQLLDLDPDLIGLIFYPKSPRFVSKRLPDTLRLQMRDRVVGVFVDPTVEEVINQVRAVGLTRIQLHGDESPEFCRRLRSEGLWVMKAFGVSPEMDWTRTMPYEDCVDQLLFDTKTPHHGGSGQTFDWTLLKHYTGSTPYYLSGGLGIEEIESIRSLDDERLAGVDLNSRFEKQPAIKDMHLLAHAFNKLRRQPFDHQ